MPSYIREDTRQFYVTANGQLHSTPINHEAHPSIARYEDKDEDAARRLGPLGLEQQEPHIRDIASKQKSINTVR